MFLNMKYAQFSNLFTGAMWIIEFSAAIRNVYAQLVIMNRGLTSKYIMLRVYNGKADSYPHHTVNFFTFRILIEFFIHEVKKTLKFWVSGPYLYNKYQ